MHRVGCRTRRRARPRAPGRRAPELRLAGTLHALRGRRRARRTRTPTSSSRASTPCSPSCAASGSRPASCTRATRRARSRSRPRATTWCASASACYGIAPAPALAGRVALRPALVGEGARVAREDAARGHRRVVRAALRDRRADAHRDRADRLRRRRAARPRAPRRARCWSAAARCPIAGTVTMDQLMVDVGDLPVEVGDEVVLLGTQGDETITAAEWAELVDTIAYEIVCGIGPRVPAELHRVKLTRGKQGAGRRCRRRRRRSRPRGGRRRRSRPRGVRRRPDADARRALDTPLYVDHRLAVARRRHRSTSSRHGEGPPIVLSHGVTLSVRTWFQQLELAARRPGSARSPSTTAATASRCSATAGHSLDNLAEDVRSVLECSTSATRSSSATRWAASRCRRSRSATPSSPRERVARHRAAVDARADAVRLAVDADEDAHRALVQPRARLARCSGSARTSGSSLARLGFGNDPHPSHVELVRRMMLACAPADPPRPRRACSSASTSLDELPSIAHPDARGRRHRRRAHPAARRAADRGGDPRRAPRARARTAATC